MFKYSTFLCLIFPLAITFHKYRYVHAETKIYGTGASFPDLVYQEATFAYQFSNPEDFVSYYSTGSSGGKCNIQGFWHTNNKDTNNPVPEKTRVDDAAECSKAVRDRTRTPVVDFAGSDSIFVTADYINYPDLLLLPAVAGAAVPIYNIPEFKLKNLPSLILSRETIALIFLGNIRYWNDTAILKDNKDNTAVLDVLKTLGKSISVAVRTDGSGTTEIFATSLSQFSTLFSSQTGVAPGEKPKWCGGTTDEVQVLKIRNCDSTHYVDDKILTLVGVDLLNRPAVVKFQCDSKADDIRKAFQNGFGSSSKIFVKVDSYGKDVDVKVAYINGKNWYLPTVSISQESAMNYSISTLQEGGFANLHFDYLTKPMDAQQRIFVNCQTASNVLFSFDGVESKTPVDFIASCATSTDNSVQIFAALQTINFLQPFVKKVSKLSPQVQSIAGNWIEYQVDFNNPFPSKLVIEVVTGITRSPSESLTRIPSSPSVAPTYYPSCVPSLVPSQMPTLTLSPSLSPVSFNPSLTPSTSPSLTPTSSRPSLEPSLVPTLGPSYSFRPSKTPSTRGPTSFRPSFVSPSCNPSSAPAVTSAPSRSPSTRFPTTTPSTRSPTISPAPSVGPTSASPTRSIAPGTPAVIIFKFSDDNNHPIFYDKANPTGFSKSGRYTCYKNTHNYEPWSYYTGNTNPGVIAQVIDRPYSIGYSVLDDARQSNMSIARMINKHGTIVDANVSSVSYAVMEKGGNFGDTLVANLVDSLSVNAWPMAGYTYYAVRKLKHIGDCERRQHAMEYLRNFYFSETIRSIADRHGFAMLPDFIRDIVVKKLVDEVKCNDGTLALAKYQTKAKVVYTVPVASNLVNTYLAAYRNVDASSSFVADATIATSTKMLETYQLSDNRMNSIGAFSMLSDPLEKKVGILASKGASFVTSSFAHIAVAFLVHINDITTTINLSDDIIAKIYAGIITDWNDPSIRAMNTIIPEKSLKITPVIRSDDNDVSEFFSRYFSERFSEDFEKYKVRAIATPLKYKHATDNDMVDSYVTNVNGAIGFFLLVRSPIAPVASICKQPNCGSFIKPTSDSVAKCADDLLTMKKTERITTYDLIASTAPGCYPLSATLDHTFYIASSASSDTCDTVTGDYLKRAKFSGWLYNGTAIVAPLKALSVGSPSDSSREKLFKRVCDVECGNKKLGYEFCDYRDCTYEDGDFKQVVGECGSDSSRKVTYVLTNPNCLRNSKDKEPPAEVVINCVYVPFGSGVGIGAIIICVIGFLVALVFAIATFIYRNVQVIKRSQTVFIFVFLLGAALLNIAIIVHVGPNDETMCILRPWLFNIAATVMFAPLIMKLHRVDRLFNNPKLKKIKVSDLTVILQVSGLLGVDILILLVWTFAGVSSQLKSMTVSRSYTFVLEPIDDVVCNSGISNPFEITLVVFKGLMLIFGVMKAVATWKIPSDLSEAKYFAVAIYNIAAIGGICYLLGDFLKSSDTTVGVLLQCLGMFITAVVAVVVIMAVKLISAHSAGSKVGNDGSSNSSTSQAPAPSEKSQGYDSVANNG